MTSKKVVYRGFWVPTGGKMRHYCPEIADARAYAIKKMDEFRRNEWYVYGSETGDTVYGYVMKDLQGNLIWYRFDGRRTVIPRLYKNGKIRRD